VQVSLQGVSKTYAGGVEAVRDVNLDIADGEFVVLVGPSGCGKSTTLRMIAGLEEITSGEISIGEAVVNDVPPKDRDIAMVFQNYALYPHMTVYKNMAFGLSLRKMPKKDIKKRVHDTAKSLDIEDLLHRKPKALSGGQRQRVALGRAIVRDPKVFLFDEPLSNLDAKLRVHMRAEIGKLHTRLGTTMIYVTHDQVEAMTMGDRIVVMLDGEIQQVAVPTTLYDKPVNMFVAGFIGSPPMNFVDGTIVEEGGRLRFRDAANALVLDVDREHYEAVDAYVKKDIVLGVRPEMFTENDGQVMRDGRSVVANVDVVEPLGSETYLYVSAGEVEITARIQSETLPKVNKPHVLDVDMAKVHFFDPDSEEALV
jgi:multiple sugar transport system ATP-binding protein